MTDLGPTLGLATKDLTEVVLSFVNWILGLLALIQTTLLLVAGFTWLTAAGNEERVLTAKKIIVNSLLGNALVGIAWAIVVVLFKVVE